ncbi:reverse transcriptase domain-containing protein [Tanacetum coccineum]
MDQKLKGYAVRDAKNKKRFDNDPRDNRVQQPPLKRQNVVRAYMVGNNKNKGYARILPLCDKCKLHHHGPCPLKCENCKKVGHQAKHCWTPTTVTCYGCGGKGHTKRYYPELENVNGDKEARQNLNIVMVLRSYVILLSEPECELEHPSHTVETPTSSRNVAIFLTLVKNSQWLTLDESGRTDKATVRKNLAEKEMGSDHDRNSAQHKARGLKWLEHTLLGQATRRRMLEIHLTATSDFAPATIKRAPVAN